MGTMEAADINTMEAVDINTMEAADINTMEAADINTMEAVGTVISMDTVMVMAGAGGTVTGTAMA
jgi:hypothetical protein